jgi:hypothetical protein
MMMIMMMVMMEQEQKGEIKSNKRGETNQFSDGPQYYTTAISMHVYHRV